MQDAWLVTDQSLKLKSTKLSCHYSLQTAHVQKSRWYDDAITMKQYSTNVGAIKYSPASSSSSYHGTIVITSSYYPIFILIVCRVNIVAPSCHCHRAILPSTQSSIAIILKGNFNDDFDFLLDPSELQVSSPWGGTWNRYRQNRKSDHGGASGGPYRRLRVSTGHDGQRPTGA